MEREVPMGMCFSIIARAFRIELDRRLREQELTGVQFAVLGQLMHMENEGAQEINQRCLEQANRVTHPTMTEIIKRLEKKGYITCTHGKTDKRAKVIRSTEKTKCLHTMIEQTDREVAELLSRGLSPEQKLQLTEITRIMMQNAEHMRPDRQERKNL